MKQILILALACLAVAANAESNFHNTDVGLLDFMSRSNHIMQRNPERSLECFDYYIPLINELAEKYEADYKNCLEKSASGRLGAEEATVGQRNDLANRADSACAAINLCADSDTVEDIYNCYIIQVSGKGFYLRNNFSCLQFVQKINIFEKFLK